MMNDAEFQKERQADDAWTGPRLLTLAAGTLIVALTVIYLLAADAAPY